MTITKILNIFLISFMLFSCSARENLQNNSILTNEQFTSVKNYMKKTFKNQEYKIIQILEGKFLKKDTKSFLIFFDDAKRNLGTGLKMLIVFDFFEDSSLANAYILDFPSDVFYPNGVLPDIPNFGEKFNQGWICDLNHNGIDEIFIYHGNKIDGMETIIGFEYFRDYFHQILPYYSGDATVMKVDNNESSIYIRRITQLQLPSFSDIDGYDTKVVWDPKLCIYKEFFLYNIHYNINTQNYEILENSQNKIE